MQKIKWKTIIITSLVCLLPILWGVSLWGKLPESVPIHFNINNQPDNFSSKAFAVFALPSLMAALQMFCCVVTDLNAHRKGECRKFENALKWIIPVMSIILYVMTLEYALGKNIDIRRVAVLIVSMTLILIGNYMPKLNYVKNYNIDTEKARRINRFNGILSVVIGVLMLTTVFLPPVYSVISVFMLIPYAVISAVYAIAVARKK